MIILLSSVRYFRSSFLKVSNFWMLFGISSTTKILNKFGAYVNNKGKDEECAIAYHLGVNYMYSNRKPRGNGNKLKLINNDVLILRLDLQKQQVEYYINTSDVCMASEPIPDKYKSLKYRMMICVCDDKAHLTLLKFQRIEAGSSE